MPRGFALAALLAGGGLLASVALLAALGVMPVAAEQPSCGLGPPVVVHYETAVGTHPAIDSRVAVSGVVLSGFPSACDGETVRLEMWGNTAGDPSVPLSGDRLLSTADSRLAPCLPRRALSTPVVVGTNGAITLSLCPGGGPAGYVSVHDLTRLSLSMSPAPRSGQVKGQSTTKPSGPPGSAGQHGGVLGATTPLTGAHLPLVLSWSLMLIGIALLFLGLWLWRRQRPAGGN